MVKFAQVKQSLNAQLQDELDLKIGQVVKITHIIDKDWYRYKIHFTSILIFVGVCLSVRVYVTLFLAKIADKQN